MKTVDELLEKLEEGELQSEELARLKESLRTTDGQKEFAQRFLLHTASFKWAELWSRQSNAAFAEPDQGGRRGPAAYVEQGPSKILRMDARVWAGIAAALALLIIPAAIWLAVPARSQLKVLVYNDAVSIQRGKDTVSVGGSELLAGDVVRTGSGSGAVLAFTDEATELSLNENSELEVESLTPAKHFRLRSGTIRGIVARQRRANPLLVVSATAQAEVIGTRFQMAATEAATRLQVPEGRVAFTSLTAGETKQVVDGSSAVATKDGQVATSPKEVTLPDGWASADVGNAALPGDAKFSDGTVILRGSGSDIWNSGDGFHFVYKECEGDGEMTVRVASLDPTEIRAKAAIMFRESLAGGSKFAAIHVSPEYDIWFFWRPLGGRQALARPRPDSFNPGRVMAPYWLRLERRGNSFTGYCSPDGQDWQLVHRQNVDLPSKLRIGLAVSSHDNSQLNTAVFDHMTISR